ncbi:MAG TPA: FtsX-like permease family protein, partial [Bryobacteraceae bacterium]|nr:FtsX-like permease family protein [Bryobacteraceae bacterium]
VENLMTVLMVTVVLVLLIACANAANLLLARAVERQHEMGIRLAVGAGRGRLVRQLLVESVALASLGAAGGFALAFLAARAISQYRLPLPLPIVFDFTPDLRVLGFTAALTVATGVLFGLAPALAATRKNLAPSLVSGGGRCGTGKRMRLSRLLVGVQVTLSVVLLTGASLFLRSLESATSIDLGIRPDDVLVLTVDPKTNQYSAEKTRAFLRDLEQRVTPLQGVKSMAASSLLPLSVASSTHGFSDPSAAPGAEGTEADVFQVTAGYFKTLGLPLVRGRDFSPQRDTQSATALINRTMARRLFGETDPIGRRISHNGGKIHEVIGVVGDSKSVTFGEESKACAYLYLPRNPEELISILGMTILVKTSGDPARMAALVRDEVRALDPNLAVFNVDTLSNHVTNAFFLPRLCATLFGAFGLVGLTLAAVGLFGVLSYSVRTRTREIGIRVAIGAQPSAILRMVLRQGLTIVLISLAIGAAIALAVSRAIASLLYGVSPTDPVALTAVPLALLGAASAAILAPARRAMRVHPVDALRSE